MENQIAQVESKTNTGNHFIKNSFLILVVILLCALFFILGLLFNPPATTPTTTSIVNAPTSTPTIDLKDWSTYVNDKYGYTFKYPPTWKMNKTKGSPPEMTDDELKLENPISIFDPETSSSNNPDSIQFYYGFGHPDLSLPTITIIPIICDGKITDQECLTKLFSGWRNPPNYEVTQIAEKEVVKTYIDDSNRLNAYFLHNKKIFAATLSTSIERYPILTPILDEILSSLSFEK